MGIPKFFRWMSERYPSLSQTVAHNEIPEYDNLYLDMNGIIHTCSHGDDASMEMSEEKVFGACCKYVAMLFAIVRPQRLFYLAVDGVAPRAKMNQQRARRFRSAQELAKSRQDAIAKGTLREDQVCFDSNAITPGTPFMVRLNDYLRYFVQKQCATDPTWRNVKVILSGHDVPGEGEHKIMDYIRRVRSEPGYDENTRHCLYGLDADLIILSLATHEPHFSLLREEVKFGKKGGAVRPTVMEDTNFFLLHIALYREYLDMEFSSMRAPGVLSFPYNFENIVDDWVLLGYLVGNDFLPHLPDLHINDGALLMLYETYKRVLPQLDGYINQGGHIHLARLEAFLRELAPFDVEHLEATAADLAFLDGKGATVRKGGKRDKKKPTFTPEPKVDAAAALASIGLFIGGADAVPDDDDNNDDDDDNASAAVLPAADPLASITGELQQLILRDAATADETDSTDEARVALMKEQYYREKMKDASRATVNAMRDEYIRGLQWVLLYYYEGVQSWGWFYPFHYAPRASDLLGFRDTFGDHIDLELGHPFHPFEQLLSVLPAASRHLLPAAFQPLVCNSDSPIIDFYPTDFEMDLNGKKAEWEAVVLVPFIDEKRLLEAIAPLSSRLTPDEAGRNGWGTELLIEYDATAHTTICAPPVGNLPALPHSRSRMVPARHWDSPLPSGGYYKGLMPNVRMDVLSPGFPTLKHVPHTVTIEQGVVTVFDQVTRGDSYILTLTNNSSSSNSKVEESGGGHKSGKGKGKGAANGAHVHVRSTAVSEAALALMTATTADAAASQLVGRVVHVGWPHTKEALVVSVADATQEIEMCNAQQPQQGLRRRVFAGPEDRKHFEREARSVTGTLLKKRGIRTGPCHVVVKALPVIGHRPLFSSSGAVTTGYQFGTTKEAFALQTVLIDVPSRRSLPNDASVQSLFPLHSQWIFTGKGPDQGALCTVEAYGRAKNGQPNLRVSMVPPPPAALAIMIKTGLPRPGHGVQYLPSGLVAKKTQIHPLMLSRIVGTLRVWDSANAGSNGKSRKVDIGFGWRNSRDHQAVLGYAHEMDRDGKSIWEYSDVAMRTLQEFRQRFPTIVQRLNGLAKENEFDGMALTEGSMETIADLVAWQKALPSATAETVPSLGYALAPQEVIVLERTVDNAVAQVGHRPTVGGKSMSVSPNDLSQPGNGDTSVTFSVGDRVCIGSEGAMGTVVGVFDGRIDVLMDTVVAAGNALCGRCSAGRGMSLRSSDVVKVGGPMQSVRAMALPGPSSPAPGPSHAAPAAAVVTPPIDQRVLKQGKGKAAKHQPHPFVAPVTAVAPATTATTTPVSPMTSVPSPMTPPTKTQVSAVPALFHDNGPPSPELLAAASAARNAAAASLTPLKMPKRNAASVPSGFVPLQAQRKPKKNKTPSPAATASPSVSTAPPPPSVAAVPTRAITPGACADVDTPSPTSDTSSRAKKRQKKKVQKTAAAAAAVASEGESATQSPINTSADDGLANLWMQLQSEAVQRATATTATRSAGAPTATALPFFDPAIASASPPSVPSSVAPPKSTRQKKPPRHRNTPKPSSDSST